LIFENYILSKSLYYYLTRFDIYQTSASGRKERKAKASERRESTTKAMRRHSKMTKYIYVNVQITLYIQVGPRHMRMVTCKCLLCIVMHISKEMSPIVETRSNMGQCYRTSVAQEESRSSQAPGGGRRRRTSLLSLINSLAYCIIRTGHV
jgi:hypothetical protein